MWRRNHKNISSYVILHITWCCRCYTTILYKICEAEVYVFPQIYMLPIKRNVAGDRHILLAQSSCWIKQQRWNGAYTTCRKKRPTEISDKNFELTHSARNQHEWTGDHYPNLSQSSADIGQHFALGIEP